MAFRVRNRIFFFHSWRLAWNSIRETMRGNLRGEKGLTCLMRSDLDSVWFFCREKKILFFFFLCNQGIDQNSAPLEPLSNNAKLSNGYHFILGCLALLRWEQPSDSENSLLNNRLFYFKFRVASLFLQVSLPFRISVFFRKKGAVTKDWSNKKKTSLLKSLFRFFNAWNIKKKTHAVFKPCRKKCNLINVNKKIILIH